jgi:hypothetical protein
MTVSAVRFMVRQPDIDISFFYYDRNKRLHDELADIAKVGRLALYPLRL